MKLKIILTVSFLIAIIQSFAQTGKATTLIEEGIVLYDQGKYNEALVKYNESYMLDSNSIILFCEMAMTHLALKDFATTQNICQRAILKFPNEASLSNIYTTYGTSLDDQKKPEEALKIYKEGLVKFPNYYMLHFNKGITEFGLEKDYDARTSFQNAVKLKPKHASSWYYLGIIENNFGNRIPAILNISRFLILEPKGPRAQKMLPFLTKKVNGMYYQETKGNTTATYSSAQKRTDTLPDQFKDVEQNLSVLAVSLSIPGIQVKKTELEEFEMHFQSICELLDAYKKDKNGFTWTFVAPYFREMAAKKHVKTFTNYINFYETDNKEVENWMKENVTDINTFLDWSKNYKW